MDNLSTETKPYAGFWWRVLASLLDGLIVSIPLGIIYVLAILVIGVLVAATSGGGAEAEAIGEMVGSLAGLVMQAVNFVIGWLYYAMLESSPMQGTLGKKICGLAVTDMEGGRISFARATGRYFGRIVSGIPCAIGYLFPFFTEKKQALHDMLASTLVLRKAG